MEHQGKPHNKGLAEDTTLYGQNEIADFYGRDWRTVKKLIREGFPAVKIEGRWESDKVLIRRWRRSYVEQKAKEKAGYPAQTEQ